MPLPITTAPVESRERRKPTSLNARRLRGGKAACIYPPSEYESLAAKIREQVEVAGPGRCTIDIKVVTGGRKLDVRVGRATAGDERDKGAVSRKLRKFDPVEAGHQAVEMLTQAEGGAFSTAELKSTYGLSTAVLHRRRKEHRIVYWRDAKHEFHYPRWQFTEKGALLSGVADVLRILGSTDEFRILRYFLTPRQQLGGSPLECLRAGKREKVVAHAEVHGEENTW